MPVARTAGRPTKTSRAARLSPAAAWLRVGKLKPDHAAGLLAVLLLFLCHGLPAQILNLPPRATNALTGTEFAKAIAQLERPEREERIYGEITSGNVPDFLRKLTPVATQSVQDGRTNSVIYYVTPDYLAVGSD